MATDKSVRSPCIGDCNLDHRNLCSACLRTLDEIAGWRQMNNRQKQQVLSNIEQRRQAKNEHSIETTEVQTPAPS